jgi:hypothetical protein
MVHMSTKDEPPFREALTKNADSVTVTIPNDWRARALLAESEEERLRDEAAELALALSQRTNEIERLQRENGSLARTYAACERLLRDRTEENERLRAVVETARKMERWNRDVFGHRLWVEMANALDDLDALEPHKDG